METTMQERWDAVQQRMADACARAGRQPADVRLVAVSKTKGPELVRELFQCGQTLFGENKVQEAAAKIPLCPGTAAWHLVGHLQSNKAARAVELFDLIHSVDSLKLLEVIDRAAEAAGKIMTVLLEVNVSGESSKFGLPPATVPGVIEAGNRLAHVAIAGLMTMPPFTEDVEKARPHFRALCAWRERWRRETGTSLDELSMGMSHDFEIAIEEGATLIRVGTALFGERTQQTGANT